MRLVGYNDLQARSAYQPTIQKQGNRYIAYVGHHGGTPDVPKPVNKLTGQPEYNGTSVIDVTDPAQPKYLAHIPGLPGNYEEGGAQMVRVCDGKTLPKGDPNKTYMSDTRFLVHETLTMTGTTSRTKTKMKTGSRTNRPLSEPDE